MKGAPRAWWRVPVINRRDWQWEDANAATQNGEWWQNAIIYQIAPWSFLDTDGDSKGDLNGIVERLDYIVSLGVDAIWLTPIYASPMDDFGYDVADMRAIGSEFGRMEDFQCLLDIAHAMKLKVLVDQIWNHTSDEHPWFQESRSSRDNPKADWYVWAEPKPDGSPPNNWLSSLTGECAWKWEPQRQQYYFFNFLDSQPDLNWYNDDVVAAILQRAKFWLDLGVDGLRIDAVNYFLHDRRLRDNPPRPHETPWPDGVPPNHPIGQSMLTHNFNRPETPNRLRPLRELVDRYPGVVTLGEVTLCEDSIKLASRYTRGCDRLHLAYHSGLLVEQPMTASLMRTILGRVANHFADGGTCWIVGNHDYGRLRSRWTGKDVNGNPYPDEFYRMMAALLLSLPGAFCLWQGDELGLPIADIPGDIPPSELKDPFGKALYPDVVGRDGSRTPMPWTADAPCGGFTTAATPWLPIPASHLTRSVHSQHRNTKSLLNTWRRLLHWRKNQPALEAGKLALLEANDTVLAFRRYYADHNLLCLFNISDRPASYVLELCDTCEVVRHLEFDFEIDENYVKLSPYSAFFGQLTSPSKRLANNTSYNDDGLPGSPITL
ncbi:Alpha amylase, catalytic region [Halomicronema hongdechloris C2206]|uniref:Alpha amylase, catalytic region n=1 Tax=Halomicronema hongdechloris C2206 TaxID=1641165 RepID=A0A1Z3HJK9_9CYAN|nr:alpha-glucosidase [Halomicronema hongdechloris]ASC70480.1 Alpha amylase, catalytic region [Halomicronema hongdechloris C2206]